ncbi:hypothetical protein GH714_043600 [Hevea brasiliensis]|uniref:Uncharacterized protein n=1 Tax=Hevea brasiliensis TaxID=3981 RepID=A0A6A6K4Y8_HEVBR|nr:hypothetical protein GH714_043600 [Hevea brasiliensis]
MAVAREPSGADVIAMTMIDETYEFSAPRFYDFIKGESEEDKRKAELWFDTALSYAPSPFMPRIKTGRSFKVESLCDFSEADQMPKVTESSDSAAASSSSEIKSQSEVMPPTETREEETTLYEANKENNANLVVNGSCQQDKETICSEETKRSSTSIQIEPAAHGRENSKTETCCTPKPPQMSSQKEGRLNSKKHQSAKHIASLVRNPSALKMKSQPLSSQVKGSRPESVRRDANVKNASGTPNLAQENQAIKRQKLEGGRSRQILNVKPPQPLHHKSKLGLRSGHSISSVANKMQKEGRKVYVRESAAPTPFVSMAEMMKKFQSSTRDLSLPRNKSSLSQGDASVIQRKPQLTLTRPKEPELETAQHFGGSNTAALPRSTPQPPEFQEFHLETTARATQMQNQLPGLNRGVPSDIESKGELGIFCNAREQVTIPQEFHFATNERIPPPADFADMFDKLSLNLEPRIDNPVPRNTLPNPFHLHTEERGAEKDRKFVMDLMQKQLDEERARIPKANPYPYTTDYPVIPPKPESKPCTKPEPFQLESLVRHEEEMRREMDERQRIEKEEANTRIFRAQPVIKEDPMPLPEKVRKPLTQVQQFNLHTDHRAVDRAEFDQQVKEKEQLYKRYREESEAARMVEEEKALKQLRRTMVPHARTVPSFDHPFCPKKSSKETTKAKSPNLRVLRRRERQKMINNAVSSPASWMR